ncbi:MAG: nicotinate-nicotinamide nucleotide adenylyltransferase, partial [Candidatus Binatota bacterium]
CNFIVTSRPGSGGAMSLSPMPVAVRNLFCYDRRKKFYRHENGRKLFFIKLTDIAISASDIRDRLKERRSIRYLVPLEVESYIKRRGLYRGRREGR